MKLNHTVTKLGPGNIACINAPKTTVTSMRCFAAVYAIHPVNTMILSSGGSSNVLLVMHANTPLLTKHMFDVLCLFLAANKIVNILGAVPVCSFHRHTVAYSCNPDPCSANSRYHNLSFKWALRCVASDRASPTFTGRLFSNTH